MLEPRFTRGEYWLLEAAVESGIPIAWLSDNHGLELNLNKPSHGMIPGHLLQTLHSLLKRRLIHLLRRSPDGEDAQPATPSELADELNHPNELNTLYYRLTPNGGVQWEAFAQPDWNQFVDNFFQIDSEVEEALSETHHEFTSANEELLKRKLDHRIHSEAPILPGSIQWSVVEPWQAVYWKTLPRGFRLRFSSRSADEEIVNPWATLFSFPRWYQWG